MNKQSGITLVSLVITIIVMLILAGVSLNMIMGDSSVLDQAQTATISYRFAAYNEKLNLILNKDMTCAGESMEKYIPGMDKNDIEKFIIINGKLAYIGKDEQEMEIAQKIGIETAFSGNTTMEDVVNITEKLFKTTKDIEAPSDDTASTPEEYLGKRLYDKNSLNLEKWNIVIEYDADNKEKARYGSGYYLLEPGNYIMDGEQVTITGKYILDYGKSALIGMSTRSVEWSVNTTLAVTEGLVLNIDPTNLASGNWNGITKNGDVVYNSTTKALVFNESEDNIDGEGGYLQLKRNGVDFSNGFTFEIYANLSRLNYANKTSATNTGLGLFCRIPTLNSTYTKALRFGYTKEKTICKFYNSSSWTGTGNNISTDSTGNVAAVTNCGYNVNEDFYLTVVYNREDSSNDKIEYYINGELFGYTYHGKAGYNNGLNTWNKDDCPFFVGVSPWYKNGSLYYLKGSVYTCRLYTKAMNETEVKENMNMTQKYRESF